MKEHKNYSIIICTLVIIYFMTSCSSPSIPVDESFAFQWGPGEAMMESMDSDQKKATAEDIGAALMQAGAAEDYNRLQTYLKKRPELELYAHYCGAYIEENRLVVLLDCPKDEMCLEQIRIIGLHTDYLVRKGEHPYFHCMEVLEKINGDISNYYSYVQNGTASADEKRLMSFYPAPLFDDTRAVIMVRLVSGEETWEEAKTLFEWVIGRYPEVEFVPATMKEVMIDPMDATFVWKP